MIGYVTLGTNDLSKAAEFYDALLSTIGAKRAIEMDDRFIAWGAAPNTPMLGVIKPHDENTATPGNGTMIALAMPSKDMVGKVHAKALELGAKDEGEPGPRGGDDSNFYGAYFRDMDGNKLAVFTMG